MTRSLVSVSQAPLVDLGDVHHVELESGLTLSEIVTRVMPDRDQDGIIRVLLVSETDVAVVPPEFWPHTRPKPGIRIAVRFVASGDDTLRAVLTVVVSVAAMALGQFWAAAIVPTAGLAQTAAAGLITAGLTVAGTMLINALIPVQTPKQRDRVDETYSITGWQNTARPGEPIPCVLGRLRVAPDFVGMPYTTIFGNDQFVTALLGFGYGPLEMSDLRIGETPIEEFTDVELQFREGRPDDEPVTVYPKQVLEQREGVELIRPKVDGDWEDRPVVRQTASNAQEVALLFSFATGLFKVNSNGDLESTHIEVRIRQRLVGSDTWLDVITIDFRAKKQRPFMRQYRWTLPERGRWEIEITKLTKDQNEPDRSRRIHLAAIQSFRPEHPINFNKPMALLGIRIKASDQISGALDALNAIVQRYAPVPGENGWRQDLSRNPASAYVAALQGPQQPFPVADDQIDWDQVRDWHDWCASKGLKYDRSHATRESFSEMLMAICAAGRAAPRHDGVRWGVVVDRPDGLVVDHLSPRNAADFSWSHAYFRPPDAFRVAFRDETNGWELAERIIPWPGHEGSIDLVEELSLPGKTDPDEVWIEARRRQYELEHRATSFSAVQDAGARVATRGDTVMASLDILSRVQVAARVLFVDGARVVLDETISMEHGRRYGLRFHHWRNDEDAEGASRLVEIQTIAGQHQAVTLVSSGIVPRAGHVVHFGVLGQESRALKLRGVQAGSGFSQVLDLVPLAPEIDALTDAETPPAWSANVGAPITEDLGAPEPPVFVLMDHVPEDVVVNGMVLVARYRVDVELAPGPGSSVPPMAYELEYQISGSASWTSIALPAAAAAITIGPFEQNEAVILRARAIGPDGTPSAYTGAQTDVGSDLGDPPPALDELAITATGGLGFARFDVAVPSPAIAYLRLYRVPSGDALNPEAHVVSNHLPVNAGSTETVIDGDATRRNLAVNGAFDTSADWSAGTGWSIAGGSASHAPGAAGTLEQSAALTGRQRLAVTISGRTAGGLSPVLTGADPVVGAAMSSDGLLRQTLDADSASSAPTGFGFDADANFDGSIDDVVRFIETTACIPAGDYDFYLAPFSETYVPGPLAGPFPLSIM